MSKIFLKILNEAFEQRRSKNPRYSLRAYAAQLGVHPSALSRILQGKQAVSRKNGVQIVKRLGLARQESCSFLRSLASLAYQEECLKLSAMIGFDILEEGEGAGEDEMALRPSGLPRRKK